MIIPDSEILLDSWTTMMMMSREELQRLVQAIALFTVVNHKSYSNYTVLSSVPSLVGAGWTSNKEHVLLNQSHRMTATNLHAVTYCIPVDGLHTGGVV